jgi:hypothetical protein
MIIVTNYKLNIPELIGVLVKVNLLPSSAKGLSSPGIIPSPTI